MPTMGSVSSASLSSSSAVSLAASTPPPSTSPASHSTPLLFLHLLRAYGTKYDLHPKMSHTNIERWCHTNLNARIQSLRVAVRSSNFGMERLAKEEQRDTRQISLTSEDTLMESGWQGSTAKPTAGERLLSTFECLEAGDA
ncbi:hypothetical protein EDD85DRAFT_956138 [Armillaria nabsnona]|nr:hypothetical protein EDD85DRAFT_956138 [Armillaria nabsnona]